MCIRDSSGDAANEPGADFSATPPVEPDAFR